MLMWTPRLLCIPLHSIQTTTPQLILAHCGSVPSNVKNLCGIPVLILPPSGLDEATVTTPLVHGFVQGGVDALLEGGQPDAILVF